MSQTGDHLGRKGLAGAVASVSWWAGFSPPLLASVVVGGAAVG